MANNLLDNMKQNPLSWFIGSVVVLMLLAFAGGVIAASYYTNWVPGHPKPSMMPKIVTQFVLSVNAILALHIGAYLGFTASLQRWRPIEPIGWLQVLAAVGYVLTLVGATVFWCLADFSEDPDAVVSVLPEITRAGVGVLMTILGGALGVQTASAAIRLASSVTK